MDYSIYPPLTEIILERISPLRYYFCLAHIYLLASKFDCKYSCNPCVIGEFKYDMNTNIYIHTQNRQ